MTQSRRATVVLLLLSATTGAVWLGIAAASPAGADEAGDAKIKGLLKERLAVLRELAEMTAKAHQQGAVSFQDVHAANEAVLEVELELAESPAERVTILEKFVAEAKKHERHVAGSALPAIVLQAKAHRLKAEIALEREKQKQDERKR